MRGLFIPKMLKVGFQKREDTFTGQLAYVIYYDEKGQLRKASSHESWCDETLGFREVGNEPRSGFVLNKGVEREGYWGSGRSVIRVHDERGFEIEITVDNLMGLLMHSDVSKRDIVERCVYAWKGTELVLLPCNSQEYLAAQEFTLAQEVQLSAKDLQVGYCYRSKKDSGTGDYGSLVYLGHLGWEGPAKKHVFWNKGFEGVSTPGVAALRIDSTEVDEGYAGYLERALRAQDTSVRVLSPKMLVPGGEYEEVLSGFLTARIRRQVYVGQFQWEVRGTYGYRVQTGLVFKKQCIFWDKESGIFSPVDLKDLNMNLSPKVVPEWGQLVDLMKKTRFTSLPGTHKLEVSSVAEALSGGWFWTGEVDEDEPEDVQLLRLSAIRKGPMGLEVKALREMWVMFPYVQDYGLSELRDATKASTYLRRSEAEVASMQPRRLVLIQENGIEIKREDYGQPVKKTAEGTFEIMRKWD